MRIHWQKCGGHYHCRVFTSPIANGTFAKNGDLVFDEREWLDVLTTLGNACVQFIEDTP